MKKLLMISFLLLGFSACGGDGETIDNFNALDTDDDIELADNVTNKDFPETDCSDGQDDDDDGKSDCDDSDCASDQSCQ